MYITELNQNGAVKMICFYFIKTKYFDINKIKQDRLSDLFQPLFNENFIKIDIFSRNIFVLMKQHVTMKHGSIYNVFAALNFRKRKKYIQRTGHNDTADFAAIYLQVPRDTGN